MIQRDRKPSKVELRWFGLVILTFFGLLAGVAYFRFDATNVATTLLGVGGSITLLYYAVEPLRLPIFLGWMKAVFPLGWTISRVGLALVYYLLITPLGLVMRLVGRDPMQRRFDRDATSYWEPHRTDGGPSQYFRQY